MSPDNERPNSISSSELSLDPSTRLLEWHKNVGQCMSPCMPRRSWKRELQDITHQCCFHDLAFQHRDCLDQDDAQSGKKRCAEALDTAQSCTFIGEVHAYADVEESKAFHWQRHIPKAGCMTAA
jgi:hypothetical protein